nr:hypothetical protein [Tanacetum cinerariifolium]
KCVSCACFVSGSTVLSRPFISLVLSSVSSKTLNSFGRLLLQVELFGIATVYMVGGVIIGNTNQNPNENGNLVAARAEGNATGHNGNQIRCYNCRGLGHFARNCTVRPRRKDVAYLQTQLPIAQNEEVGIQFQAEEFDLMAAAVDLNEIEEVNANCILMANLQQA